MDGTSDPTSEPSPALALALVVEPPAEMTEAQRQEERIQRYRPLAIPAEFEERVFDRLVSENTTRMQALLHAITPSTFTHVKTLNLAGFYPNPKEPNLLFDYLKGVGEAGPHELVYVPSRGFA